MSLKVLPVFAKKIDIRWAAAIVAMLAIILVANPVGFVGGGWDDWQYLNAARCWAEQGPCLPHDHWQARWPIVAPLGAIIAVLGESRLTVGLPSLAYSLGCLALLAWLGNRLAGKPVGYLATLFLLAAPVFAIELLDPTVEAAELFFLLAAACCAALFAESRGRWMAFGAGMCLSLAFQVRETSVAAAPIALVAAWLLARDDRKCWLAAIAGAALPLVIEGLGFWLATGDPLWRRHLSIAHTRIPSSELLAPIDRDRTPFLNTAYIANWRHEPGIHVHWLVDGLVNLFANLKAGATIALSALFFAIYGRDLGRRDHKLAAWCLAIALYWACLLIYVLAIDPKPRMMFVPIALTALALAILVRDRIAKGSALLAGIAVALVCFLGLRLTILYPQVRTSEPTVEQWASRFPQQIETDETTRRHLALTNAVADFDDLHSGRPMLVMRLTMRCSDWAEEVMKGAIVAVGRSPMGLIDPVGATKVNNICLFRYVRPVSPEAIQAGEHIAITAPPRRS